jgi:hypothetical protein
MEKALREAEWIVVEAVVSDHKLLWVGAEAPAEPVDPGVDEEGNPLPLVKRTWQIGFESTDVCP